MATCESPRCSAVGRWSVTATGRRVCAEHIPDGQAVTLAEPRPADPAPADEGILAAVCPPGWRRSPLDGRPVMPCVAALSSQRDEIQHTGEIMREVNQLVAGGAWCELVRAGVMVLLTEAAAMRAHGVTLSQSSDNWISRSVDKLLRLKGQVRIRLTDTGWEEVGGGTE